MKTKNTKSKAERIMTRILNPKNHGKTAAELARLAGVDHNHVYVFENLVKEGFLRRNNAPGERELEHVNGDPKPLKGGRGSVYFPGRKLLAAATGTKKVKGGKTPKTPKAVEAEPAVVRTISLENV